MAIKPKRVLVYDRDGALYAIMADARDTADFLCVSVNTVRSRLYDGNTVNGYRLEYEDKTKTAGRNAIPVVVFHSDGSSIEYRSIGEASHILHISVDTIRRRIDDGGETYGMTFDESLVV